MKYPTKKTSIHLPSHDPELVDIIEETIDLREQAAVNEKEWKNKQEESRREKAKISFSGQNPQVISDPAELSGSDNITSVPSLENQVRTHEEILDKNTNYVFLFGYTGSGKSTVLTAINMYMRQHYRVILNQSENQDGIRLIHQMMRDVEHGYFPQPTSIGQITEYDTAFLMNQEDVNITFLEMAGEDLKKVDVDTGEEGLPETVKSYLSCPGISISFLLIADYERVVERKEDKLILQFLSYLYNEGIDLSRVGVVLSKFDRGRTDQDVEDIIKTYLPQVDKWLTSGDIAQPRVFPFSIGDIRSFPDRKDEIDEINLDDCAAIVPWLHEVLSLPGAQSRPQHSPSSKGLIGKFRNLLGK